ncbi:photosystem reaction center subunit H [Brasilonema octagenarum UFV-E1]|uniref:Photosystem reaction center subunit H n=2 Tax=Brasilonema TaxID=383614 RepID=A0A856MM88_9CYAN|nr:MULTISPECIES: DUF2382 domain-containing protein [Brasilonema]NMF64169.1 photosystem reaction center subunit H [Brasilonema octagenarum UFV-OR1]QDL11788.1 photosystem reaction center subunit H [Brasilonema sennae CENA114]QDL18169.1 photosystem reaction center subunit H [Brasilonema octagenarum UFV-E1]
MGLYKIADFDADYKDTFQGNDIKGMGVYGEGSDEKVGTVSDVLVDEEGHFRYLVVDLGFWIFGKKVLLPVGRSRIDYNVDRVYAIGMTREQAERLPEYNEHDVLDYDYEERVRGTYRAPLDTTTPLEASAGLGDPTYSAATAGYQPTPVVPTPVVPTPAVNNPTYDRDTYKYDQDAPLYNMNDQDHQTLRLYEERLVANKRRQKAGEVTVGKHIETETARVAIPVEKERVVVERVTPADAGRAVAPGEATFREGEVARVEIYEETADVRKEAFLREEVRVKKVVDQDTVEAQETIRREELDINAPGLPIDER